MKLKEEVGVIWKRGRGWTRKQRRNLRERKRGSGCSGLEEGAQEDGEEEKGEQCGSSELNKGWTR